MKCPLCHSEEQKVMQIDSKQVVNGYNISFGISVEQFFKKSNFSFYDCSNCRFKYFGTEADPGDSKFYAQLQQFSWYYNPFKWEHRATLNFIDRDDNLLEVGCGTGEFLKKLDITVESAGLELNDDAVKECERRNLNVLNESVEDHSKKKPGHYDIVCSFQVLEHISNVRSFIKSQVKCLKRGGRLVVGVPNNGSFINLDKFDLLNMPPHHMGRWSIQSLSFLQEIFPLKIESVQREPLQSYHYDWYISLILGRINFRLPYLLKKLRLQQALHPILRILSKIIPGHTILVVFKKI